MATSSPSRGRITSLHQRLRECFISFRAEPFDERFPYAAWEDIEFAYRATALGMKLRYVPRARCLHHHRIRIGSFCARQETSGRSAAIFASLHPELEGFLGIPCVRRQGILDALQYAGYATHAAADGKTGAEMAVKVDCDLLLLDLILPRALAREKITRTEILPELNAV